MSGPVRQLDSFSGAETKEGKAGALPFIWCDRTLANGQTTISEMP